MTLDSKQFADAVASECGKPQVDRLQELKLRLAVEAYEKQRDGDTVMHHYWVKEAGDPEAIGDYFPTGEERESVPVYRNQNGLVLSREAHGQNSYSWVIGHLSERRPLYGAMCDDLSAPTLGWQAFAAPEPLPVIRYYTQVTAAKKFKDRGQCCLARREWREADAWYSQALSCELEEPDVQALLYSNRAEVRLRLQDFRGAAEDADEALRCLAQLTQGSSQELQALRRQTVLRLAAALQAMRRSTECMRLLNQEQRNYPECEELRRLARSTRLALAAAGRAEGGEQRVRRLVEYVAGVSEGAREELAGLKSGAAVPASLSRHLGQLEYVLLRAEELEDGVLEDVQSLLQVDGFLRCLLNLLEGQWRNNAASFLDIYKLPACFQVASLVALICQFNEANLRFVAPESLCLWALLGGCNCKVPPELCERLLGLADGLWTHCRAQTLEILSGVGAAVAERVAFFLSQAVQADGNVFRGPDAPALLAPRRVQAARLLLELLGQRLVLRGALPQLGGLGQGFFDSEEASLRILGELVARRGCEEPQLVEPKVLTQLLQAAQRVKGQQRYFVLLMDLCSLALEHQVLHGEQGSFEAAFRAGNGLSLALEAQNLRALAAMSQTCLKNVETMMGLGVVPAVLRAGGDAGHVARVLLQCSVVEEFLTVMEGQGLSAAVAKLCIQVRKDGNMEALHDLMQVLEVMLRRPALWPDLREKELLQLLLRLESEAPVARSILEIMRKERSFQQLLEALEREGQT